MIRKFILLFLLGTQFIFASQNEEYEYLNNLSIEAYTDKGSLYHNYTKVYSKYFADLKEKPLKFLEIGISHGNSVKMWEKYFPNAELHFIDITDRDIDYYSERSQYHFLDQENQAQLVQFIQKTGGAFDIIIDDGGHTMGQQFISFATLFPSLKSGGLYIIEDLCTSYWVNYGGGGTPENPSAGDNTMIGVLRALIDYVNYPQARTGCADIEKLPPHLRANLNYFQENVSALHFYSGLCIIEKR